MKTTECAPSALEALRAHLEAVPRDRSFGNARLARLMVENMMTRQAGRLARVAAPGIEEMTTLLAVDVPEEQMAG
ncbi:hypothetical protein ACFV2H_45815 [Streptomyces sp. NPDC059629]|uniref:hypothetical protein n=1 Tax=Streptomyces sp. NPDC059629 TaxID=3346889 RepID=UPI0036957DC0